MRMSEVLEKYVRLVHDMVRCLEGLTEGFKLGLHQGSALCPFCER